MKKNKPEKVICAISGGIDSSVAAALLKRAGGDELRSSSRFANAHVFNVIGVFLKLADTPRFKKGEKNARKVAKELSLPFLVLDLRKEFQKKIINEFIKEHKAGRTPNPCVVCNREMKFKFLLKQAKKLGAFYVATGHYARFQKGKLLKGKDKEKDQSYFLWQLNQKQLKHVLFPVGDYTKKEVRNLAKKFKLPVFETPESQEVCFIQTTTVDFLKKYLKTKQGKIIDTRGKKIGKHSGLSFYTIGQRKGMGISGGPYYVLDKNIKKNLLVVTKKERELYKKELIADNINWISGKEPGLPLKVKVKIRYRSQAVLSKIFKIKNNSCKVIFIKAQRAITPGQSIVFYRGEELLGGGIIC